MEEEKRTLPQNNSLHLYFTQLAEALNNAGYDVKKTLREEIEIPWTSYLIKELIWRKLQIAMLGKESTTELLKEKEIDLIYEVINREIGNRTGVAIPFPSEEELMNKKNY